MSDIIKDGGPAFPQQPFKYGRDGHPVYYMESEIPRGMSLRDWFAGMAMQGFFASKTYIPLDLVATALLAFDAADAMIAAREKKDL